MNQILKLLLELGPLVAFFVANGRFGIFTGTATFVVATILALATSWLMIRKVPLMPLVSGVFVLTFGGLTLWLHDDLFIKLKPTLVNLLFAAAIFTGLALKRNVLKTVFEAAFRLTEEGWRVLAIRWGLFFVVLAALNEAVWRSVDTDTWVSFKVFGILPLTLLFSLFQIPVLQKYQAPQDETDPEESKS